MATERQTSAGGLAASAPPPGRTTVDSRKALRLQIQQLREQGDVDDFYIDENTIPDGMSYELKRYYDAFKKPDEKYRASLKRMGWTDVPARRHPELFGPVTGEDTILLFRDMALMERPIEITQDARRFELRKARKDVRDQSEKLRLSTAEHFDRKVQVARTHHAGGLSDRKTEYNGEIPGDDE